MINDLDARLTFGFTPKLDGLMVKSRLMTSPQIG